MLGAEKEIVETFVTTGQVKIAFSPLLDLGPGSINSAAAAYCIGFQDPTAFWLAHDRFFEEQSTIYTAGRDYYVQVASEIGVDQATFEQCYDNGDGHALVTERDNARRQLEIYNRPTIDINGQRIFGNQRFSVFEDVIRAALP